MSNIKYDNLIYCFTYEFYNYDDEDDKINKS